MFVLKWIVYILYCRELFDGKYQQLFTWDNATLASKPALGKGPVFYKLQKDISETSVYGWFPDGTL